MRIKYRNQDKHQAATATLTPSLSLPTLPTVGTPAATLLDDACLSASSTPIRVDRGSDTPRRGDATAQSQRVGASLRAGAGGVQATTARQGWIDWLSPAFAPSSPEHNAMYFTGTYSDDYGLPNGLMLQRNVHKDFRRWLDKETDLGEHDFVCAVERHAYRDILHLHAMVAGSFTADELLYYKRMWAATRGHARSLPILDGCASYVTKYALKADTDALDFRLT